MKTIIFGRHGETEANKQGLLAGATTDSPLTEAGREHAHELSRAVAGKPIDLVIASPLSRAYDTAQITADDIGYDKEIVVNELFIERDFGSASSKPKAEAFAMLDSGEATGVESVVDFGERARRALDWLRSRPEGYILVVSHAAFGQMLGTVAAGGKPEDFLSFHNLSNGGVFELVLE